MLNRLADAFRPIPSTSPLWPITHPYAWSIPVVALLSLIATALEGVGITLLIPLFSVLSQDEDAALEGPAAMVAEFTGIADPATLLTLFAITILGMVILKGVVASARAAFVAWIDGRAGHDIRCALAERLLTAGLAFHIRQDPSRLVNVLAAESWKTSEALRLRFDQISNIVSVTAIAALLLIINWKLTLLVAAGSLVIRFLQKRFVGNAKRLSDEVLSSNRRLAENMVRAIDSMKPIRIFGQQQQELASFAQASRVVQGGHFRIERFTAIIQSMMEVAYAVLFLFVMLGAYIAGVSLPVIITFMVLLYRFEPNLRELSTASVMIASTRASVAEVEWLLTVEDASPEPTGSKIFDRLDGPIRFEEVTFSYSGSAGNEPVLERVSFEIRPGRVTALIGASGSGKSTIINLLCGLIQPTSGEISIAGTPLSELDLRSWRSRLGMAGQDIDLITMSIRENIAYGLANVSDEAIEEVARQAQIHDFIAQLPHGYDTQVGTRALALSGGQRQRIGLARALLRKPDLLILDEATSAVDGLSEATILKLLVEASWSRTTLVVSHHPSALEFCQDGIVVRDGAVLEAGPLAELHAYRQMTLAAPAG